MVSLRSALVGLALASLPAMCLAQPAFPSFLPFTCDGPGTGWKVLEDRDGDGKHDVVTIHHCNGSTESHRLDGTGPTTWTIRQSSAGTTSSDPAQSDMASITLKAEGLLPDQNTPVQLVVADHRGRECFRTEVIMQVVRDGYTFMMPVTDRYPLTWKVLSVDGRVVHHTATYSLP